MNFDSDIITLNRLSSIIKDSKNGLDPDLLSTWYRIVENEAKNMYGKKVMGIERSFEAALLKSIRSLENDKPDLLSYPDNENSNIPMDDRLWDVANRIRN